MDKSRCEIRPGVWLDVRKALYLEVERVLCVADLHLGYHWAHRHAGQLMPLAPDNTPERIEDLCKSYKPERLVILGDIIHRDVPSPKPRQEIRALLHRISDCSTLELVTGNHDERIGNALGVQTGFHKALRLGEFLLTHGDSNLRIAREFVIMGHEHPAIHLGDGVRGARFPCFLVAPRLIVLPAFSNWASGCEVRSADFMSPIARKAGFTAAIAIMGNKLLKVPLE